MKARLSALLFWPIWLAQLGTGAKSFLDNPIIGSRRLNRLGLHRARLTVAHGMTRWRRALLARQIAPQDRAAFDRQGYIAVPNIMDPAAFVRMRDAILARAWPTREMVQGHAITRRIAVDPEMLRTIPELAALLRSRRWRGLMHYVAANGSEPVYYIQTIVTHGTDVGADSSDDPQNNVHSDAFQPSMKAWLFLSDVALEDGPLTYVAGSHKLTPERLAWEHRKALSVRDGDDRLSARGSFRIERQELPTLGYGQPTPFDVAANTLIIADTFGFHARGPALRPSVRVELWAYSRRNPFLPWTGLDPSSLPGVAERRVGLMWRFRDRFRRFIGQPWRDVGMKHPDER